MNDDLKIWIKGLGITVGIIILGIIIATIIVEVTI